MAPRVLVVDDDSARAAATVAALSAFGYTTTAVGTARDAYARVKGGQADALVAAHTLPDAPGLKLVARLRQDGVGLPIVLTAAPDDAALRQRALRQLTLAAWLPATVEPGLVTRALASVLPAAPPATWTSGALGPLVLARVLLAAWSAGATGVLHLGRQQERRGIELLTGAPVGFLPAAPLAIAEALAADGRVTQEELEAYARRPDPSLLVKMGVVEPDELTDLVRERLEEGLSGLLTWDAGRYVFRAAPVALASVPPRLDLPRWLFGWVRGVRPAGAGDTFADRAADRYVAPTVLFFDALPFLDVGPFDAPVLAALEETPTGVPTEAILRFGIEQRGHDPSHERAGCLDALQVLGLVQLVDAPLVEARLPDYPRRALGPRLMPQTLESVVDESFVDLSSELAGEVAGAVAGLGPGSAAAARPTGAARAGAAPAAAEAAAAAERAERETALKAEHAALASQNYYEVFGVTQTTYSYDTIKQAYFSKLKRFSPDYFVQHGSDGAIVSVAEDVTARLATAYNTLSNVVAKENYDRLLNERGVQATGNREEDALQAEVQLQSGQAFLAAGDFEGAERALTTALSLKTTAEGQASLGWAIFKNPRNAGSKTALERAKGLLGKSLAAKPSADAFAYRGAIFLAEAKPGLAEIEFQKALRLSPRHRLATRELAAIEERRAQEEKGFFRRLFT
jgi:CheY-like chemotaxis protein/curved DNA-binding protein CbpA